jgi:hypothetical protein
MIKNILQSAESIRNDCGCIYDINRGYDCTFTTNGDVEGWDVYDNIYLYGCWNKALFGTSNTTTCYIGRTDNISPVVAEDFPIFRMMLKITAPENPYKDPPTTGKIQWKTSADDSWDDNKSEVFDIRSTESWFLCDLPLDEHQYWANTITALRVILFENGYEGISFAIRYIRLESVTNFACLNTQCSYYTRYSHPCPGTGNFSSATADVGSSYYTTLSGVSDSLIVNIDGYGDELINLGSNEHVSGVNMAKRLAECLNKIDIGSYAYATVEHTEDNKLKIVSGNLVSTSDVVPLTMGTEFTLYIHAYSISDSFISALDSVGVYYYKPFEYFYVLYGDLSAFMGVVYGNFLNTNSSYYVNADPLIDVLTDEGYFTNILAIKSAEPINIVSVCCSIYDYGEITLIYPSVTDVDILVGFINSSARLDVLDVTNNDFVVENYGDAGILYDDTAITKTLKLTANNTYTINCLFVSVGQDNVPTYTFDGSYGSSATNNTIEKISSIWLQDTFGQVATDENNVVGTNIVISGGTAAEVLGFYTAGLPTYTQIDSTPPATGFEYAASRRLRNFEISKLINNDFKSLGYFHNPNQPVVDAGRRSYYESLSSNTISVSHSADYYTKLDGAEKIIIDFTHPISDCGRLNNIKIGGSVSPNLIGEVLIFRPYKDGTLLCIDSYTIPEEVTGSVYSRTVTTNYLSFNLLVSKGDLIGFKNIDLLCPFSSKNRLPNATMCILPASTDVSLNFDPGSLYSKGVIGPSYYAYSNRLQDGLKLDIDLGKRFNINKFQVYGKEYGDYFEYNLAACLDVDWKCNLFGEKHTHIVTNVVNNTSYTIEHLNMAYGLDSLSDCSVTADSGREGTSYDHTEGLATYGEHTYFYVNGDAEWLNGYTRYDSKSEFNYPYYSQNPTDYENDPIQLYITVPENKQVYLHRATVYFKESPNFKKMGISYYLGADSVGGNAEVIGYQYIDSITSVSLDGVTYYPDPDAAASGDWTVGTFITTNPLPDSRLGYVNGTITNSDLYLIAGNTEWNVVDYNFDPVAAYGFMLYSDWHKSTKIIEIELYSKFDIKPTLIDNILIQTSVYGDTWDTLLFDNDPDDTTLISAFVSSSPRYFKMAVEPQDEFEMYELSLSIDESGKGSVNCVDSIIPTTAKKGEMSSISCIEVENIYDVPLHLYVNIPKSLISFYNLLSWVKLSSEETTLYGEIGPGAVVHKNKDYPLISYNNQIAINCPSYYLKNLIDGKSAYTYDYNKNWRSFGTLSVDNELNYSNRPDSYVASIYFDQVASRYWKIVFGDMVIRPLNAFKILNNTLQIEHESVYMQVATGDSSSYKIPVSFDSEGVICATTVFDYTFLDSSYLDTWTPTNSSGIYFLSTQNEGFYPTIMPPGSVGRLTASLPYYCNSFKTIVDFTFFPHSYFTNYSFSVELQDTVENPLLYVTITADHEEITLTASSYDPDSVYDLEGYSDSDYGSASINRSQIASIHGQLRLVFEKVSKDLNYIKLTDREESTEFIVIEPDRTYFSSRLANISFTMGNVSNFYLPTALPATKNIYSDIRSIVIDCSESYGESFIGLRSIEFYDIYGEKMSFLSSTDFIAYTSSYLNRYYAADNAFDTSLLKNSSAYNQSWRTGNLVSEARIICNFKQAQTFGEIIINNYHSYGTETSTGVKNIKIYAATDNYTDTTYMADIPNGILIYDGGLLEHVGDDVIDDQYILLGGSGDAVTPCSDPTNIAFAVNSVEVLATPFISNFDSLIFEFDSVTALDNIQISTEEAAVDQAIIMITDQSDGVYETWARNSSKLRMTTENDSTFVASGYIRYTYQYRGTGNMNPYYTTYRGDSNRYVWLDVGTLPLWVAYDFGEGNACTIDSLRVELRGQTYTSLPDLPDVIQVYGSNDPDINWLTKPKDLLSTISGSLYSGQNLEFELNTIIPYRYYCLYAPNLDQSIDDYTLGFRNLCMYSHLDAAKSNYYVYAINYNGTTHSLCPTANDLYFDSSYYTYALAEQPHYLMDLRGIQPVSGIKLRLGYITSFQNYASLEYSVDSTNGIDGSWSHIATGAEFVPYYAFDGTIIGYFFTFTTVYASWLRIYMGSYVYTVYSRIYDFMPILGEVSSQLTLSNESYNNYFVVDLGDVYSLDFIRNYGDSDDLLNLFDSDIEVGEEALELISLNVFNTSGVHIWTAPEIADVFVDVLIVGGGGAGGTVDNDYWGSGWGGGGGAGGFIFLERFQTTPSEIYEITVGGGGVGSSDIVPGANGGDSSAFGFTAVGGGGGGGGIVAGDCIGRDGGSGGGGGAWGHGPDGAGGHGTFGQGNDGGQGYEYYTVYSYFGSGGGGGGAGSVGQDAQSNNAGDGGTGQKNNITGNIKYYAAGGGGASRSTIIGYGGSKIGGNGGGIGQMPTSGVNGTGSGGGGGVGGQAAGSGGTGVVIIKCYKLSTNVVGSTDLTSRVMWKNYVINSKVDARWLKFPLICGLGEDLIMQNLGIYPDISKAYRKYGGFNCDWVSVGTGLSDYSYSLNVAPQASLYYGNLDTIEDIKTVIIDIYTNHGSQYTTLAAVELYDENGDLINLYYGEDYVADNYTPLASTGIYPEYVFNTNNSNIGHIWNTCWNTYRYTTGSVRISCILNESVKLSKIAIQNAHNSGSLTTYGAKLVAVWLSSEAITSTVFEEFDNNTLLVFYDELPQHAPVNAEDRYLIDLVTFTSPVNTYFNTYYPSKCIQGDSTLTGYSNSWGFGGSSGNKYPTLELKLDYVYNIKTFKLTHAPDDDDTESFINTSYRISGKADEADMYTQLFYITNNTQFYREHTLDNPIYLRYIKLEIISYEMDDEYYYYDATTGTPILINGGFLREFEIWTSGGGVTLNSEEHPVVCMNLKEAQTTDAHELVTLKESVEDITWDNSEEFFSYSDNVFDDPNKVSFQSSSGNVTMYSTSDSYMGYDAGEDTVYVEGDIYLHEGSYKLSWESYNALYADSIRIVLKGADTVKCINSNIDDSWRIQVNYFSIDTAGYYTMYLERLCEYSGYWGARTISIVKNTSNTKWISVKRDTATNHAWTDNSDDYGVDYINRIRVYAENTYLPTEFPWFWSSVVSTISREHANVKEGRYALRVDYPTSSGVDRVDFLEGDHFGWDENWSVKDTLSFWWFISDLDNLYVDEGGFGFGSFNGGDKVTFVDIYGEDKKLEAKQAYYLWDFKDMNLKNGWNEIKLQFDRNTCTAPLQGSSTGFLEEELNFRENYFTSFGMVYKGVGEPFYMLFDGLKIERNYYNDVVKDDKGLCLTWKEYAEIPLAGVTLYTGTVEFWVKPYTLTNGRDIFCNTYSRVLFTLTNNYNEIICLTMKSSGWFEIGFGGARYNFNTLSLDPAEYDLSAVSFDIDEPFHIAVVWSNSGTNMDNSDTLRLYINNTLVISSQNTWEVSDTKSSLLRLGGGSTILANNNDEEGSAIFSHVKVYDYCKDSFALNTHIPEDLETAQGNEPIRISKDGVDFYNYNSDELPLKYEEVGPGEKVKIYTRIDKTNKKCSTDSGTLEIDWEVIV